MAPQNKSINIDVFDSTNDVVNKSTDTKIDLSAFGGEPQIQQPASESNELTDMDQAFDRVGKAAKAGMYGLDIVGSALRPLTDVPIALTQIPSGVVEYFRGNKPGTKIASETVEQLAKSATYGPVRALTIATGGKVDESLAPRGFDKTLEQLGVPEEFNTGRSATLKNLPQGGVEVTPTGSFKEKRKDVGKVLDVAADLAVGEGINRFATRQAPKTAEMAAEMTPASRAKLRPGTGEKLLKDNVVEFGDTAEDVLSKAKVRQDAAGKAIGDSLEELDRLGASKLNKKDIAQTIRDRASKMASTDADIDTAKSLRKIADDIENEVDLPDNLSLSFANKLAGKQGAKGRFNLLEYDPNAKAEVRNIIRKKLESHAETFGDFANALGDSEKSQKTKDAIRKLKEASEEFSYYKPVTSGIKKKLNTKTTPGGFYDTISATSGAAAGATAGSQQGQTKGEKFRNALIGGMMGGVITPFARRAIAPRTASSIANILDMSSALPIYRASVPTTRDILDMYKKR